MQPYVVNLARSPERRAHIMAQLANAQVSYEIVDAVDAREVDFSDAQIVDPAFAAESEARPGVVGCSLSHMKVYRKVLEDGLEVACIIEDDVVLPADFSLLTEATAQHMSGAEVILLNFHSYQPCRLIKAGAAPLPSSRLLAQVADERDVGSTGCYLITREACARMLQNSPPVRVVADGWAFFRNEGAIDRVRCVVPMPVVQSPSFRTTINYQPPSSVVARIRESIAGSKAPVLRQAMALRRRRHFQRYAIGQTVFVEESPGKP